MPKKIIIGLAVIAFGTLALSFLQKTNTTAPVDQSDTIKAVTEKPTPPNIAVVATNLQIPWDIAFLPEGGLLITERRGDVLLLDQNGESKKIFSLETKARGEGGLLGLVLHPQFADNHFIYFYLSAPGTNDLTKNRVERYRFINGQLSDKKIIISGIPGALYHDGGRIEFGPDGYLYITTGDATKSQLAQDLTSLAGKTLRVGDDGRIPADNPFKTAVYSYGHRNSQGLAWDSNGRLWATEHGRSGALSGMDEINLIVRGGNYGWPQNEGDTVASGTIGPVKHSGPDVTWAPASALYWDGSIFFGGLRGQTLYEARLSGARVVEIREHFKGKFGRIRTVRLGPDQMFYLTTSNRDDRGKPEAEDDKIIRLNPAQFR